MKDKLRGSKSLLPPSPPGWFDKLAPWKRDALCIGVLFLILYFLCFRIITEDMAFADSGDTAASMAWGKAIVHLDSVQHSYPLWIPYIFSGMPVFGALMFPIDVNFLNHYLIQLPFRLLFLNAENSWMIVHFFIIGIFAYAFARVLKFGNIPSLFAAMVTMMSPYMIELPSAGHGSKVATLSYIPLVLLLTYQLLQKRNLLYLGLLAAAVGTMLLSDHVQIAYYGLLVIGFFMLYEIILDIKSSQAGAAVKKTSLFALAVILGLAIAAYVYLPTQEYSKYSIRGGGEAGVSAGLDMDYATQWSFHPFEMFNLIIPSTFGFSSQYITDWQGTQQTLPMYWGWMPFTTSTVYIGILPIILCIFALSYRRNRMTIFLTILAAIIFLISFGKFSPFFYQAMFAFFPFFNKFRVPAMILHLLPFVLGLLATYGFSFFYELASDSKSVNIPLLK
ncbi:MAG TPA: hypothetical protein VKS81_03700, partial [Bacteroidota bacterium]|nr:hypothetical protein [Bacteroidota bacterium]